MQDSLNNAPPVMMQATREEFAAMAEEWNAAMSLPNIAGLPKFYADEVLYYGSAITRDELIEIKKEYLMANADVQSTRFDNVTVEPFPDGAKVNFTRTVQTGKGTSPVNGYVVFKQISGEWKITTESEMQSDIQRIESGSKPMSEKEIASCDKAAEAIFRSSKEAQGMLRAPNASYKLEYRPGDPDNPNRRYWFWVFGSPIAGARVDTYGRFQVDPETGDLYRYIAEQDKTMLVDSDAKLKKYLKKYCGQ